jgi:hypothetical protein
MQQMPLLPAQKLTAEFNIIEEPNDLGLQVIFISQEGEFIAIKLQDQMDEQIKYYSYVPFQNRSIALEEHLSKLLQSLYLSRNKSLQHRLSSVTVGIYILIPLKKQKFRNCQVKY